MGNNRQKSKSIIAGDKIIDFIKRMLTLIINSSLFYYGFLILICVEMILQTVKYGNIFIPGIYFLILLGWKIYRIKNGYKSFSLKIIKKYFSSSQSKVNNVKKKSDENKGYKLIDK